MWNDITQVLEYFNQKLAAGEGLVIRKINSDEMQIGDGNENCISIIYHDIANTQVRSVTANIQSIQIYDCIEFAPPWTDLNDLYLACRLTEEWASPGQPSLYGTYFIKRRAAKLWDLFEVNKQNVYITTYDADTGLCNPIP